MLNSFGPFVCGAFVCGTFVCGAFVALFYTSVEAKCTLGVAVCRFSGEVLIVAFKRRFRVVFWFIQHLINLHSRVFRGVRIICMRAAHIITMKKYISS